MFRCQKCKKWLKNITTETDVVYDGTIYHATNVPAKICPECGKITIYEIIQEQNCSICHSKKCKNIDYAECENEEASASQLIL
ncbi:MAG: YgiT-type zinc finger protein [Ruminococcus sp.]